MTGTCRVCGLRRRIDVGAQCERCRFVQDVLVAANPVPACRLPEVTMARNLVAFGSRGRTNGIPVSMGNSGRGPLRT